MSAASSPGFLAPMYPGENMSRAGSRKPIRDAAPEWVAMLPREIEKKVVELGRQGMQPAAIGLRLRDQYGVPSVHESTGKRVTEILAANKLTPKIPVDLANLIRRSITLQEHLLRNRKDLHNQRGLEMMESRIRRLAHYYQKNEQLPADWKYSREASRLLVD